VVSKNRLQTLLHSLLEMKAKHLIGHFGITE
jgi:hypothetical protein